MKKKITVIATSFFLASFLHAETTTCDALNSSIDSLETSVTNQQALVSKLSDDIGTMADRINTMADKIGVMADRIVKTETLLSQTLLAVTGNSSSANTVVLLNPLDSTTASKTTPPTITLSPTTTSYLLYASTSATFEAAKTITLYVDSQNTLTNSWNRVTTLAATNGDVIYIAVKGINNSVVSALSNGVKLTLQ